MSFVNFITIVDSSEKDCVYGIISVENVSVSEVQKKIYEIKNDPLFKERFSDRWQIDDILSKFPKEWNLKISYGEKAVYI